MSGFTAKQHMGKQWDRPCAKGFSWVLARLLKYIVRWSARAGLYVALIVLTTLDGGCLWAPDIHERNSENQPPQLDYSLMEPDPDMVVVLTGPTVFSVASAVYDPDDPLDKLSYWWFVDYRQKQGAAMFGGPGYSQIQLDPCRYPQLSEPGKQHTLEVVVADPSGKVEYDASGNRKIEHAAIGLWVIQSKANCQ